MSLLPDYTAKCREFATFEFSRAQGVQLQKPDNPVSEYLKVWLTAKECAVASKMFVKYAQSCIGSCWKDKFESVYGRPIPLTFHELHKDVEYNAAVIETQISIFPGLMTRVTEEQLKGYPKAEREAHNEQKRNIKRLSDKCCRLAFMAEVFGPSIFFDPQVYMASVDKWLSDEWICFVKAFRKPEAMSSEMVMKWRSVQL